MPQYDYDLFVIGAGSGGVRAARLASMLGKRVGVAEEHRVGGTCVVRGCVPKKFMVYASEFAHDFEVAQGYGWSFPEAPTFDWKKFITHKDVEIGRLSGIYASNLMKAGAELVHSKARLKDPHTIEIVDKGLTVTAEQVLIATGGRPVRPNVPGAELGITSEEAFQLPELPKRILIVGGGYIAVEFAGIFNGLGVETHLVYRGTNILKGFDEDVRAHLAAQLERRGITVILGAEHKEIRKTDGGLVSVLTNGIECETDHVMFATGRRPYVGGLGLEAAGVELSPDGAIKVDDYSRTTQPGIWAIGDVTDRLNLTPVAIREAVAFVETAYKDNPQHFDYDHVPTAVFSQPEVGTVGLTEFEARRKFGQVDVYRAVFRPMKYAFMGLEERVLMKMLVDPKSERVVGVHIVGPEAGEMIQMAAIAVKAGVTKKQWDSTCALHPTIAEEIVTMREKYIPPELQAAE
jgi:glutathione reductase (NADPH)